MTTRTRQLVAQSLTAGAMVAASGFNDVSEYDFFAVVSCRWFLATSTSTVILASVSEGTCCGY
jgi:hypothetical protein